MSDIHDILKSVQQKQQTYDSWVAVREECKGTIEYAKDHGMCYEEACIFISAVYAAAKMVNPAFEDAAQYWTAEVYDRWDEWCDV